MKTHTISIERGRTGVVCTLLAALSVGALQAHAQAVAADEPVAVASVAPLVPTDAVAADLPASAIPAAPVVDGLPIVTRVSFSRGTFKPGIERLRVVRRQNTINNVAGQVMLNVLLLGAGIGASVNGFSKDELAGDDIAELLDDPVAVNPGLDDLGDALSRTATRVYTERAAKAQAEARQDGSTPEEIAAAGEVPKALDTPLYPRGWALVYENLSTDDGLYRLKFSAEMGRAGFMRPPMTCAYASDPLTWSDWQADHWKRLREERAAAVSRCAKDLGAYAEARW